jgi:hypothetical protein
MHMILVVCCMPVILLCSFVTFRLDLEIMFVPELS